MKWMLQLVLLFAIVCSAEAQDLLKANSAQSESPVNIALEEVNKVFVSPPEVFNRLKSAKAPQSSFKITYVNFPEEAKPAFQYAVSIWENLIVSPVPIHVQAHWEQLEGNILAKGRPSVFFNNFSGAPRQNTYYPVALTEKLTGKEMNAGNPDIICHFNSKIHWYFGTDGNTPSTHYDFVSSVLHEITHGLGFSGFLKDENGKGFFHNDKNLPSIYDYYLFNNQNQQIADNSLFRSPSTELHRQLTSDNLKFCQTSADIQQNNIIDWIYAPSEWNEGTSIYHLKGYAYGEENGLMTPAARKGEAIHNPGEITLAILSELGWNSVSFDFQILKDTEDAVSSIPVDIGVFSDADKAFSSVRVIYSTDGFLSAMVVELEQKNDPTRFLGELELDFFSGKVEYYFEAKTEENRKFRYPADAPLKMFSLRIGPDYYVPDLFHNPVKVLAGKFAGIDFVTEAKDNLGIKSVTVEYKINGVQQKELNLENQEDNLYSGTLWLPEYINTGDRVEYRITAEDNSSRGNKRSVPALGYQKVELLSMYDPVMYYSTDFNGAENDFVCADFSVSEVNGITGKLLHTQNPYPVSALEKEKYNLTAQLKYPVIIQSDGEMSFDEIVLVEPGEPGSRQYDTQFWDYVVVEASKDGGFQWIPITDRYDSGLEDTWYSAFKNSFSNNTSLATPHERMFVNHRINLTQNTGLEAGDTVIFRFRMASDNSVSGWGWAIDNLEIQKLQTGTDELMAEGSFQVYPNPVKNKIFVQWSELGNNSPLEVLVTDLIGKTIFRESGIKTFYSGRTEFDLTNVNPGIYLVSISDGNRIVSTNKIVKN
jgi:hypothetical protein